MIDHDHRNTHGQIDINVERYVSFNVTQGRPATRLSSDPFRLSVPRCKTESRKSFYFQRTVPMWNQLPLSVRSNVSLSAFKTLLPQFYRDKFVSDFLADVLVVKCTLARPVET